MLVENGSISVKLKQEGGGLNSNGFPSASIFYYSEPIPAQIRVIVLNKKGIYSGEQYINASYEILIEQQEFDADVIKLDSKNVFGKDEFSIISIEYLPIVGKIKIIV